MSEEVATETAPETATEFTLKQIGHYEQRVGKTVSVQ